MMRAVKFEVVNFHKDGLAGDQRYSIERMLHMLEGLVRTNETHLLQAEKAGKPYPPLYRAGVRYEREVGSESWQDIPTILAKGFGDCEDMAAWRTAELRHANRKRNAAIRKLREAGRADIVEFAAEPHISWRTDPRSGAIHAHAQVFRREPDGRKWIEDPALQLGMGWEQAYAQQYARDLRNPPTGPAPTAFHWKAIDRMTRPYMKNATRSARVGILWI